MTENETIENDEDLEEELEDEDEDNYVVQIYIRDLTGVIDEFYFYADDDYDANKLAQSYFQEKYNSKDHEYEVSYIGSMRSDRAYEMEYDRCD